MTKGAAPGHVCVATALPDTMTRRRPRGAECLTTHTLLINLFNSPRETCGPCFKCFSFSQAMLRHINHVSDKILTKQTQKHRWLFLTCETV